jgi:hypothetical protein
MSMRPLMVGLLLAAAAGCATDTDTGDDQWGPVADKADGLYGGQVAIYGPIAFDSSKSFTFTGSRAAPAFRFNANEGDRVSSIATISNNAPPWLVIINEELEIIGQSHLSDLFTLPDGRSAISIEVTIPRDDEYFLVMSSTWTRSRVTGATITVDLQRDLGPAACEPVTCELFCPNGFANGADGCAICSCN